MMVIYASIRTVIWLPRNVGFDRYLNTFLFKVLNGRVVGYGKEYEREGAEMRGRKKDHYRQQRK